MLTDKELSTYSDKFVLSQVDYYKGQAVPGRHDFYVISATYDKYKREAIRRGLIKQ